MCTTADYGEQYGECQDNTQTVSIVRTGDCNGPNVKEIKNQSCTVAYSVSTPFALFFAFVFIALTVGMIAIALRNKMLHDRYEMLVNASLSQGSEAVAASEGNWGSRDDEKL